MDETIFVVLPNLLAIGLLRLPQQLLHLEVLPLQLSQLLPKVFIGHLQTDYLALQRLFLLPVDVHLRSLLH